MPRILLAVPILGVFVGVLVGGHWYIVQRVVLDAGWSPAVEMAAVLGIVGCALLLVLQPIGERTLRRPLARLIAWPASIWMGLFFYLFLLAAFSDLVLLLGSLVSPKLLYAAGAGAETAPDIARGRALAILFVGLAFVGAGLRGGLGPPALARVEITLDRWPAALDGFRIVQISDIHIGPILGRRFAQHVTERVNALAPDIVAVTGDLVDGNIAKLRDEVEPFSGLRGRYGVYFVTGNHDHYSGAESWSERATELGMRVLRNERLTIRTHPSDAAAVFELAGVDDHRGDFRGEGGEDLDVALADLPSDRPVVLLAHDPSTFKRASTMSIDLQLSGHTHGGQIWPFAYFVRLAVPFVAGLYRRGNAQVYVSRGTGFWGPPMRLFAPAEITEITLRSPSKPG